MSRVSLTATTWHGYASLKLESAEISLIVVPQTGARIVSLFDKAAGYEWLVAPEQSHPFRDLPYGTPYNPNNTGGWDEMLPTIVATGYPVPGALKDIVLPDHGEVWTLPWDDAGSTDERIRLSVTGLALPYRFTRTLSLTGASDVLIDYEIANLSAEPLAYLWTAHPQFACEPGAKIMLPAEVTEVVNVLPLEWGEEWGPVGTHNAWPVMRAPDGTALPQDTVGRPERHRGRKFYLPPDRPIGRAGIYQPGAGCRLSLAWNPLTLPYCGVWIDEGCLNQVSDVAIEPATGYYDDLALAWHNGRISQLAAGSQASWQLAVRLERAMLNG